MASPAPFFTADYARLCPQLSCGELLAESSAANTCPHCGTSYRVCAVCRATNRLLSGFCRACGAPRSSLVWSHHPGLCDGRAGDALPQGLGPPSFCQLDAEVLAAPLAADGIIIVADRAGEVTLVDEGLAKKIGSFTASPAEIKVTPAYASGMLFVAADNELRAFDLLDALDAETGAASSALSPVWHAEVGAAIKHPPVCDGQNVYIVHETKAAAGYGPQVALTTLGQLDGAQLWSANLAEAHEANMPAVVFDGTICLVTDSGRIFLVERDTGKYESFVLKYQIDRQVTPFVHGNRALFASTDGAIFEVVKETRGTLVNQLHGHGTRITTIAAGAGYIVLGHTAGVTLLNERGQSKWSCTTIESSVSVTPLPLQNGFLVIDDAGTALLFHTSQANPTVRRRFLNGHLYAPPIATAEHFIAVSYEGRIGFIKRT